MVIKLLKLIFGKLIGLDAIPEGKKELFWEKLGEFAVELVSEMAEGAARGAVEGNNE